MRHGTTPEHHARPGNPLASQSRALLAFHARRRYFPDGDADRARFVENERVPGALLEARFPAFESFKEPVFVDARNAREAYTRAWIDGDKKVTARDTNMKTFATSIKCHSVKDGYDGDIPFTGKGSCTRAYETCMHDPGSTKMNLRGSVITRIPACMSKYTNLKELDLRYTGVSHIENIDKNTKLEDLWLHGTKVSKIENLDKLVNLKYLWLNDTKVSQIENLDKNVKLEVLGLYGTNVSQIKNLDNLVNLEKLDLNSTKVSHIENLDKHVKLVSLGLYGTKVSKDEKRAFEASRPGLRVY